MKKKIIYSVFLLISIAWIGLSLYSPMGLNSIGSLLTFSSGLPGLESPDAEPGTFNFKTEGNYKVTIKVDSFGVPHIFGKTANAAGFGIGYMQARDRYVQMELMTRSVQGQLCELVGESKLESDLFWKKYDFDQKAKEALQHMSSTHPEHYEFIIAYSEGVNYYLQNEPSHQRAFEYKMLNTKPRQWEPHYSLLLPYYMSHMLTYRDWKIARQEILDHIPLNVQEQLYNYRHADYPYIHPGLAPPATHDIIDGASNPWDNPNMLGDTTQLLDGTTAEALELLEKREQQAGLGSNNWAVAPTRSASGKAMLCNDTHLGLTMPGPWYEMHIVCPDFHTYGFGIPCSPHIISGTNQAMAWGITNGGWDLNDYYRLEVNPDNANQYKLDGEWTDFMIDSVVVSIKGKADHIVLQKRTVHGFADTIGNEWFAEYWYASETNTTALTFGELAYAKTFDDFKNALGHFNYPPQNFAYADRAGHIGIISAGNMPLRDPSYDGRILDGTVTPPTREFVPFPELPQTRDPEQKFVQSANQNPGFKDYYINYYWPEPYRAQRINDFLSSKEVLSANDMKTLHADISDISSDVLKELYKVHFGDNIPEFVQPLMDWDGIMDGTKHEPLRYTYLRRAVIKNMGHLISSEYGMVELPNYSLMLRHLKRSDTVTVGTQNIDVRQFLLLAVDSCKYQMMTVDSMQNPTEHLYSELSTINMDHILKLPNFGEVIPNKGGSANSPNVNHSGMHGPSMRTIFELGNPVIAHTIHPAGQSGRINSKHFRDQVPFWIKTQYRTIQLTPDPAAINGIQTLEFN